MNKKKITRETFLIIASAGIIVLLILLILDISNNKSKIVTETNTKVDSLRQSYTPYIEQISQLTARTESLNQEIESLKKDKHYQDSVYNYSTQRILKEKQRIKRRLYKSKKRNISRGTTVITDTVPDNEILEQLHQCQKKETACQDEFESLNELSEALRKKLEILHSRHDIPILFLLAASISYYPSAFLKESQINEEFDRISKVNNWHTSSAEISNRIHNSPRTRHRGIKWAQTNLGCPLAASYFLSKEFNLDPEKASKKELVDLYNSIFKHISRHLYYSSNHLKEIVKSEPETLKLINETITCLKQHLKKKMK